MPEPIWIYDCALGRTMPRWWAQEHEVGKEGWSGYAQDALDCLLDPDHEWYWETWETVLDNARFTDEQGTVYYMSYHPDTGDLMLYPNGYQEQDEELFASSWYDLDNHQPHQALHYPHQQERVVSLLLK